MKRSFKISLYSLVLGLAFAVAYLAAGSYQATSEDQGTPASGLALDQAATSSQERAYDFLMHDLCSEIVLRRSFSSSFSFARRVNTPTHTWHHSDDQPSSAIQRGRSFLENGIYAQGSSLGLYWLTASQTFIYATHQLRV
ncbi:MAG: hypothetical protein RR980_04930 [Mucinivorans sp.]